MNEFAENARTLLAMARKMPCKDLADSYRRFARLWIAGGRRMQMHKRYDDHLIDELAGDDHRLWSRLARKVLRTGTLPVQFVDQVDVV